MLWICATCGVETADLDEAPLRCEICSDERQWVPESGQAWTTLADLTEGGTRTEWFEVEPGLYGVRSSPTVGIGQQTMVVSTPAGVVVFDPLGFVDDECVEHVRALGKVLAVVASHPHMYGCQTVWAAALDAPVVLNAHDAEWCRNEERVAYFDETYELGGHLTLHRVGGHFRGQTVAEWRAGADGRGVLLAGDAVSPNPDRATVTFLRSYPNRLPLSGAVVKRIARQLDGLHYDQLYNNFGAAVPSDAKAVVRRSAERYAAWTDGLHDDETW
ncbi:MAG: hydrolase [Actinobacteria bacterium]|nr:hydrolase [Actinomycetota bacterium]